MQARQRDLQELTGRLLVAQESERKRIARELHDDLGQYLALLSVQMDLLQQNRPNSNEQFCERVNEMSSQVKQLSTWVHDLSHQLHPIKLEQLGLVTAVSSLCKELTRIHGLSINFAHRDVPTRIPQETALCLYRVAQEALSNAVRHSGARNVNVEMHGFDNSIALDISDNGSGFDPTATVNHDGLGLVSMRERLRAVNGLLTLETASQRGTQIKMVVPLTNGADEIP